MSGLAAGDYLFRVRAQNADGWGPYSEVVAATVPVPVDPPLTLLNVSATPVAGGVLVDWDAPLDDGGSPVVDYRVQFSLNGGVSWQFGSSSRPPVTEATVSGLAAGDYLFRVRAQNADGWGP